MPGERYEYSYDPKADSHQLTWAEGVIVQLVQPKRDAFRHLKTDVIVWAPGVDEPLNRGMVDLLSEADRARFHQNTLAKIAWLNGNGDALKSINFFERLLQALNKIDPPPGSSPGEPTKPTSADGAESPWRHAKDAPSWLAEPEVEFEGLAKDLIAPGVITLIASPRGLGKTQVSHALAVALATGGIFRGERVKSVRVLLLDRDNPETIVKRRLRAWGAIEATNLRILTRQNAPALQDKAAWEQFPLTDYDVLIVDSVGSSTEGITEKEGKQTTEVLATILDLSRKGLAILLLQNVTKDGMNFKGRGEWADRVDILYEIRDATSFTPSGKKPWWQELPPAGEAAWAERAARRKGRIDYRLAFIPSKFRLGVEPEPFCLELHLPPDAPWTLQDVTEALVNAGEAAKTEAERAKEDRLYTAALALSDLVAEQAASGTPMLKTQAETWLCGEQDLRQREARELIKDHDGRLWTLEKVRQGEGKQSAWVVLPKRSNNDNEPGNEHQHKSSGDPSVVTQDGSRRQRYITDEPAHSKDSETTEFVVNARGEMCTSPDNDELLSGEPCPTCRQREWVRWIDGRLLCHRCLVEDRP